MKKYLIVLMILFILMGVFSMDILGRSAKDIQARIVGQIEYSINVVKGVVESENINKTYNCYIAGETAIYPNIPTFSRNPKLQPGDRVTIEFINGCRETPAILAPEDIRERPDTTLPIGATAIAFNFYTGTQNYVAILDTDGNIIDVVNFKPTPYSTSQDGIAVDSNGNIYINGRWSDKILKLSSLGVQLAEVVADTPIQIAIAPDGSIWDYEYIAGTGTFVKRNAGTLAVEDSFVPAGAGDYFGMAFGADGSLYTVDWIVKNIEKYNVATGARIGIRALAGVNADRAIYSSLAVTGTEIVLVQWPARLTGDYFTCPTDLSADFIAHNLVEFPGGADWVESITALNAGHYIVSGDSGGSKHIVKYTIAFVLVWDVIITDVGSGLSIGAYPF